MTPFPVIPFPTIWARAALTPTTRLLSPLRWHLQAASLALLTVLAALALHLALAPHTAFQRPALYLLVAVTACSFLWGGWGGLYASVYSLLMLVWVGGAPPLSPGSVGLVAALCAALTLLVSHLRRLNLRLQQTVAAFQQVNAELNEAQAQLYEAAYSDPLTRLGNRRAFDEDLSSACGTAEGTRGAGGTQGRAPFTAALIDLDGLKLINDQEGHLRGDALLRAFARSLQSALPAEARLYRFGGDEFALIWPQQGGGDAATPSELARQQEQVTAAVALAVSFTRDLDFGRAAASVGSACVPQEARDGQAVLALSDRRLYAHKRASRSGRRWTDAAVDAAAGGPPGGQTGGAPPA